MVYKASTTQFTTAAGTTNLTVNKPTGVIAGDLLIMIVTVNVVATTDSSISGTTGWTLVQGAVDDDTTVSRVRSNLYIRTADGTEPASAVVSATNVTGRMTAIVACYDNYSVTTGEGAVAKWTGGGVTTRTTPSVTTAGTRLLVYFCSDVGADTPFTGVGSDVKRAEVTSTNACAAFFEGAATVAAGTYSKSPTSTVNQSVQVNGILALTAASAPPGSPTVTLSQLGARFVVDANGTPPSGETISGYTIAQLTGATITPDTLNATMGIWGVPYDAATTTWRVTATASGGGTATADFSVPPLSAAGVGSEYLMLTVSGWS